MLATVVAAGPRGEVVLYTGASERLFGYPRVSVEEMLAERLARGGLVRLLHGPRQPQGPRPPGASARRSFARTGEARLGLAFLDNERSRRDGRGLAHFATSWPDAVVARPSTRLGVISSPPLASIASIIPA